MGGGPNVVSREVPERSRLPGRSCVLIDGGLVLLEPLDQTLLLWVRKLLESLFAGIFLQKQTKGL